MSHFDLLSHDDNTHSLLEPPSPAYSNMTVRRAFIMWLHCGQRNEFRHVCNYFHRLEALEEKMSPEARAKSRSHEFSLFTKAPPTSTTQQKVNYKQLEEIKLEGCVFNLEGYYDLKIQKGVTTKDIIKTSQMIRRYCIEHSKTLRNFLVGFLDFTKKAQLANTVNNISVYIKKKYVDDELVTYMSMPKHFSFLDDDDIDTESGCDDNSVASLTSDQVSTSSSTKTPNKIRILINEARRKEIVSSVEDLSELSANNDCDGNHSKVNLLSSKIIEDRIKTPNDEFDM